MQALVNQAGVYPKQRSRSFLQWLHDPVSIAPLVTFRILYGAMMAFSTARFIALGWIEDHYLKPKLHFKYYGFEWVEPLGPSGMYVVHALMLAGAVGIMVGALYRWSAIVFFLTFTYGELIDITYYLNHYYFVSIVSFLLIFLPANRAVSLDVRWHPSLRRTGVPRWVILLIQVQLSLVYIYAGLAKLRYDWLINALPLKIWLPAGDTIPFLGPLFAHPWTPYFFSWAGMLYDTFIVFFLIWPRTRFLAYLTVIFFHSVTGILFQIGVFPLVMIASTPIFFSEEWHRRLWGIKNEASGSARGQKSWRPAIPFIALRTALFIFVGFQLLFPWRFLLYPGNLFWTEQGYRYGWRVMLMEKAGTATFYVKDSRTGREGVVDNREFLNDHQEKQMAFQPDLILQFAHFLADHYEKQGLHQPQVRAEIYVTLNGRPSQLYIDPTVDLAKLKDDWRPKSWINPYQEPFR